MIEAATTDAILKDVADIAKQVKKVADSLAASIGTKEGERTSRSTLQNLAEVTEALNQTVRENRAEHQEHPDQRRAHHPEGRAAGRSDPRERAGRHQGGPRAHGQGARRARPHPGEVRQIIEKVNRASASLEKTLSQPREGHRPARARRGHAGRLTKDEKLINEVEGVAEGVNDFVGGISRLQTIVALRTDYQFLSSTVKSYVELRLQPREDKYYSIEMVNDPRGLTRIEQTDVDTSNPNDPPHYREVRTVTTNSFRFSLQFAQRLGPFVGRFGIKESTGGVGSRPAACSTIASSCVRTCSASARSCCRAGACPWATSSSSASGCLAGVDDIFSGDRRDYFVGLQLKFNDEDLKTMLPFAPKP